MSSKKKQAEEREQKDWERVDEVVFKSENFLEKNAKSLLIAVGVVVLIACGYLAYDNFYVGPQNEEAQKAIFRGQQYFDFSHRQDSLALYGDGNGYIGFLAIADQYSSTKTGKLAKAYAGICYASLGQYDKAYDMLKSYSGDDKIFSSLVQGSLGDCLVNQGKQDDAISYFIKAAEGIDSKYQSPALYKKAALVYREKGNYDEVIRIFTLIKDKYLDSEIAATEADKYIDEANVMKAQK